MTHEAGTVKFNIMKHHGLGDDLDAEKVMKEDGYDKALEAELETEFTKVDLGRLEAQTVSASAITSATTSNDQSDNVTQEDSIQLEHQAASEKTTEKPMLDSPEPDKQTLEGVKSEKVEDMRSDTQDATKRKEEEEETHQLRGSCAGGEKQSQKEETPDEIKKNEYNGGEASTTKGSMQTATSDQEQGTPKLLTSGADK